MSREIHFEVVDSSTSEYARGYLYTDSHGTFRWHVGGDYPVERQAVLAHDGQRVVGVLKFYTDEEQISECGVYVAPSHRRRGIARQLFEVAIAAVGATRLRTTAITDGGRVLIESLRDLVTVENWGMKSTT